MRSMLLAFIIAVTTTSCDLFTATARGISVLLEANPKVAQVGDTVTFIVNVAASGVSGIVITYGDSVGDQSSAGGAATARVTFKHAYLNTGNYQARATVSDAVVGDRVVTEIIVVIPRSDSTQISGSHARSRPSP